MSDTDFDRLERIFADAIDLDGEERTEFLDGACGGDAMLRAQVASMLDDHVRAAGFMRVPNGAAEEPGTALAGQRIGRYRIDRVIASGGMGTVYVATQDEPQREVALKVMKRGIASRSALRRFGHESQILARLHHPGIAQVYDVGVYDDGSGGVPYFVMEYIRGARTLTEYARSEDLETPRQRV